MTPEFLEYLTFFLTTILTDSWLQHGHHPNLNHRTTLYTVEVPKLTRATIFTIRYIHPVNDQAVNR